MKPPKRRTPAAKPKRGAATLCEDARGAAASGDFAKALLLAETIQARFPGEAEGYRIGIEACQGVGEVTRALVTAEQAAARFSDESWPLLRRAELTRRLGRLEETIAVAETLRLHFPEVDAGYAIGLSALRERERLSEASAIAEEAARRFGTDSAFPAQAAELRALTRNRARALSLARKLQPASFTRPRVVVMLGMHRSGSSLAARTVQELGVGLGAPLMPGNHANPDGFFEHLEVFAAHNAALRTMGLSWDSCWSVQPREPRLSAEAYSETRARLQAVAVRELEANNGVWAFKDPRTLRFLPLWAEIFDSLGVEPIWLLAVRDPRAVAASLYTRDRLARQVGELLWIEHVLEALAFLGPRLSLILRYELWFEAPQAQLEALARAVGRSGDGVFSVRPELRHETPGRRKPALPLSLQIHDLLSAPAPDLSDLQGRARACQRQLRRLAGF